jgi:hypothetical protein
VAHKKHKNAIFVGSEVVNGPYHPSFCSVFKMPASIGDRAGRDKKVLLQSHADRQADRQFMTTSSEILMSLLSTETLKTEI